VASIGATRCATSDPTPVNQPNKAAITAAEEGEGRAQMKENIGQSRMLPTQSGNRMSQGLDGVRKAAKERKQERFTSLRAVCANERSYGSVRGAISNDRPYRDLTEQCGHETFQISGFWADYGQTGGCGYRIAQ
jgi:hypothetical protein